MFKENKLTTDQLVIKQSNGEFGGERGRSLDTWAVECSA